MMKILSEITDLHLEVDFTIKASLLILSVEIFFRKENIHFRSRSFFLFLEVPMARRLFVSTESLVSCIIHVATVTAVGNPEVAGSIAAVDHKFHILKVIVKTFLFHKNKNWVFWQTLGFFDKCGFSPKNNFIYDIIATKRFFQIFFGKNEKLFSIFLKDEKN